MRELIDSESKTHHRIILAAGVIGFLLGGAGALMLDQIIMANDSGSAGAVRKESIEPVTTAYQAEPHGEDGRAVADAPQDKLVSERAIWRLHVIGTDVNLRAGPSTTDSVNTRLKRGTDLIEIKRSTDWIHVEIPSMKGKRGWIHQSLVDHGTFDAATKNDTASAGVTPRSTEAGLDLASDGRCPRSLNGDNSSINCFQRGDDNGVHDETLDIFQDLIKLKKYSCDRSIGATNHVKNNKNRIFLVQCDQGLRYRVEIIGNNIKVQPVKMDVSHQVLKY